MIQKLVDGVLVDMTPEEEAEALARDPVNDIPPEALAERQRREAFNADLDVQNLIDKAKTASVAEIDAWLTNNVTTLAQARAVLAAIIKLIAMRLY